VAAPAKLISTSIGFQDPKGNVVANGMLMLTLSQTATVTVTGGQVTTEPIYLNLDANGKITNTAIWFVDELSPTGLIYYGTVFASNKTRMIPGLDKLQYSITGASFDLATAVQSGPASPSYSGAVMLTPSGSQTITTGNLTLTTGTFIETASAATGTGGLVRATSPTLVTPALGVATATSIVASSKLTAGSAAAGGSTTGDITAARSSTSGAYYLGSDGAGFLFRNGNTVTLQGTTLVWTMPASTGTLALVPTITLKKGSGAGNYTGTNTSFANVDGTNLSYTVTIPVGWKLSVQVNAAVFITTATAGVALAIVDGSVVVENQITATLNVTTASTLGWVINGDGASHTITLQAKTTVGADAWNIFNDTATRVPTMVFLLTPSN
jgi:hypothetical protein